MRAVLIPGVSACVLLACVLGSAAQGQSQPLLARVFVAASASDADAVRIRDAVLALGGSVKGYARGDVFVIAAPPDALQSLGGMPKVSRIDLVPVPQPAPLAAAGAAPTTQQRVATMGPSCMKAPTAEQAQRAAALARPAPMPAANALSRRRALLEAQAGPPSAVDNSLSPHFPPIGDQEGRASCAAWAAGYYWATYTQAADEGHDVSGVWLPRDPPCDILTDGKFDPVKFAACLPTIKDPPRPSRATEHIGSPAFLYPLVHLAGTDANGNPSDDTGAFLWDAMAVLDNAGIGSWQMKPYDPWRYDSVVLEWPTQAQWLEALPRRTRQTVWFDLSETTGFAALKQHLANGNLAVGGFDQYENVMAWGWDRSCQNRAGACPGMSEDVLVADGLKHSGGHAITLVGYDDGKRWFDAAAGHWRKGAFLVANSASPAWGVPNTSAGPTAGFFWMAYDYARTHLAPVMYAEDRPHYRPQLYATVELQATDRAAGQLYAGVGLHGGYYGPAFSKFVTANVMPPATELSPRPFEPGKRLVIDMTDGVAALDPAMPVPLLFVGYGPSYGGSLVAAEFIRLGSVLQRFASPDPPKALGGALAGARHGVMCTNVLQNFDVNLDGQINRIDVEIITTALNQPAQCLSDPRDVDRSRRIDILDARKTALRCTYAGCAVR